MLRRSRRHVVVLAISAAALLPMTVPFRAAAQTYPIDCAILLCLSGGWPASAPCARARAEFIRRITPWPVEPPLQIWRCPMGASYGSDGASDGTLHIHDILFDTRQTPLPCSRPTMAFGALSAFSNQAVVRSQRLPEHFALYLAQDRADIDISGAEFDFVRSIRVYHVRYARQRESGRDGDCNRGAVVSLGTYGTQGEFAWQGSSPEALPDAHVGLDGWGEHCPDIFHRSVFVDWRDYEGNYGYEQVNY